MNHPVIKILILIEKENYLVSKKDLNKVIGSIKKEGFYNSANQYVF